MNRISQVENRDCMEAMRDFPDKFFNLSIVDPPYGIGATGGTGKYGRLKFEGKKECWDSATPNQEYFAELRRVSQQQIIWGGNYFDLPPNRGFIVWHKGAGFKGRDFAECEFAWTSIDCNARVFEYDPLAKNAYKGKIHPTQKPVALYKWLLTNYARPGDKILDTHLGSGSSRIAAWDMGFDFWGYELDKDYFEAMEARFKAHTAKPALFAPEQMYQFEQKVLEL